VTNDSGPNPSGLCMCGCGERTRIASRNHAGHGHVKGQPLLYIKGHQARGRGRPARATQYDSTKEDSRNMQRRYVISGEEYAAMLERQAGRCAICGMSADKVRGADKLGSGLEVDHDHRSGAVRELLCNPCNRSLGGFQDSPELLRSAIEYLAKHGVH
jgi:hypothetical protein